MLLRNMALTGRKPASVQLEPQQKPIFEEGVALAFGRWTALQLGVLNEWGGPESSAKAQSLLEDVIQWFYTVKDHDYLDLEDLLDEALQLDFNIQAEDDSPYQMARNLVNMHNQVAGGDYSYVETLRKLPQLNCAGSSQRDQNMQQDDESTSSEDEEDADSPEAAHHEDGDAMEMDDTSAGGSMQQPRQPIVDEDGFQVVQRKGRGSRR